MSEINASNKWQELVEYFVYSLTVSMNWLRTDAHNCEHANMQVCDYMYASNVYENGQVS